MALKMRRDHRATLSVSMLKRRIPPGSLTGREAVYLLEMSKGLLSDRRSYVEHSPARTNGRERLAG